MVFPVKHVMAHFYDDWGEIRGNGNRVHEGIDIRAPKGAPVVAIADGKINTISYSDSSGYYIAIDHENGWLSLYVHLNDDIEGNDNLGGKETAFAENIYLGAEVLAGQIIGFLGDSGKKSSDDSWQNELWSFSVSLKKIRQFDWFAPDTPAMGTTNQITEFFWIF